MERQPQRSFPEMDTSHNLGLNKKRKERYTKKVKTPRFKIMIRFFSTLITLGTLGYGAWWLNDAQPQLQLKQRVLSQVSFGSVDAFEVRFAPNQIAVKERLTLVKKEEEGYSAPQLRFYPYLLMHIKFTTEQGTTKEGVILWDRVKGEMVLDTKHWATTHGFADCIDAKASKHEYALLATIEKHSGQAGHDTLAAALALERKQADLCIERCQQKKLIVKRDHAYRIHLENPCLQLVPGTKINTPLMTKTQKCTGKVNARYSPSQIQKAAQAAFGQDFAIRSAQTIFLPVHSIQVKGKDGSLRTGFWNALTGHEICHYAALIE